MGLWFWCPGQKVNHHWITSYIVCTCLLCKCPEFESTRNFMWVCWISYRTFAQLTIDNPCLPKLRILMKGHMISWLKYVSLYRNSLLRWRKFEKKFPLTKFLSNLCRPVIILWFAVMGYGKYGYGESMMWYWIFSSSRFTVNSFTWIVKHCQILLIDLQSSGWCLKIGKVYGIRVVMRWGNWLTHCLLF